jgi:hypothetical protein
MTLAIGSTITKTIRIITNSPEDWLVPAEAEVGSAQTERDGARQIGNVRGTDPPPALHNNPPGQRRLKHSAFKSLTGYLRSPMR